MLKMTTFYEPGVDDQMVLRKFWNEDLQIKAIENAEAICQEGEESLYRIFDGIWQNRNYGTLLEHYEIHESSNNDLHLIWMEIMTQWCNLNNKNVLRYPVSIGRHAPDPLWDNLSLNL